VAGCGSDRQPDAEQSKPQAETIRSNPENETIQAPLEERAVSIQDPVRTVEVVYETTTVVMHDTVQIAVYDTVKQVVRDTLWVTMQDTADVVVDDEEPDRIQRLTQVIEDDGITPEVLEAIRGDVPQYRTVSAARLDSAQCVVIAAAFSLQPNEIRRFRWGHSIAPPTDPDAGKTFYAVWADGHEQPFMLRIR
jgi:hypothetical protein